MKNICFFLIVAFSCMGFVSAQNGITTTSRNPDYIAVKGIDQFFYITPELDLSDQVKVATYKLEIDKQGKNWLWPVFSDLWEVANKAGANSFAIESAVLQGDKFIVEVSTYNLNDAILDSNFSYYEDNIVVIFGDLNTKNTDKTKSYKVDKEKQQVAPYTYNLYRNTVGDKLNISVGGFMGSSMSIRGEEGKAARCYTLGSTRLMPSGGVAYGSLGTGMGVGVSISTGSIFPMDLNFGLFVMTVLDTVSNRADNTQN